MRLCNRGWISYIKTFLTYSLVTIGLLVLIRGGMENIKTIGTSLKQYTSDTSIKIQNLQAEEGTTPQVQKKTMSADGKARVLVLTYQRSGSSFMGQTFNQNPEALYWFEPADGIYSHVYGTSYGWNIPGDIFNFANGTSRSLPQFEIDEMVESLHDIFHCGLTNVPTEVLAHKFLSMFRSHQNKLMQYIDCLVKKHTITKSQDCWKHTIRSVCPLQFSGENISSFMCAKQILSNQNIPKDIQFNKEKSLDQNQLTSIKKYQLCQYLQRQQVNKCLSKATSPCNDADIVAMKTVRVTMETVEQLLKKDPSIYVIHYIRDPRATVLSMKEIDKSFWSLYGSSDLIKEAEMLCQQVLKDVKIAGNLETIYPGTFLTILYEDLALNTVETLHKIYNFINKPMSNEVESWFNRNTKGTTKTSSKIAKGWMEKLTYDKVRSITDKCAMLFEHFDNPWAK